MTGQVGSLSKDCVPSMIDIFPRNTHTTPLMKIRTGAEWHLYLLIASLFVFATSQSQANNIEVDWTSSGFSTSHITINAGDEVDIVNFDYDFDLQVTGAPPEGFYADIPPTDGYNV